MNNQQIIEKYERFLTNNYPKNTKRNYSITIKQLLDHTKKNYDEINKDDIEEYKQAFLEGKFTNKPQEKQQGKKDGLSKRSLSTKNSALRNFYESFLEKDGVIRKAKIRVGHKHTIKNKYSKNEIKKILQTAFTLRDQTMIATGYYCGLRVSEICELKREDIDLEENRIRIIGKRNEDYNNKFLPQPFVLIKKLIEEKNYDPNNPFMFQYFSKGINARFKPFYSGKVERLLKRVCEEAEIPYHGWHALRHSIGTHLRKAGWGIRERQLYLRHKNISTTTIYDDDENVAIQEKGFNL